MIQPLCRNTQSVSGSNHIIMALHQLGVRFWQQLDRKDFNSETLFIQLSNEKRFCSFIGLSFQPTPFVIRGRIRKVTDTSGPSKTQKRAEKINRMWRATAKEISVIFFL